VSEPRLEVCTGAAVRPWLAALAELRISVFREWPYLYDGEREYEARYLDAYARSPGSVFALALVGRQVVGAATGIPLADDQAAFQQPFAARGIELASVFYFGESVLLPAWRGRGLGHRFFDAREAHAANLGGFRQTAFCAVDREADDDRRPAVARSNEAFWRKRGYVAQPGMHCRLDWKEVQGGEVPHTLTVWTRTLCAS
jgi:GNAT superfamily N-acetyltransferase